MSCGQVEWHKSKCKDTRQRYSFRTWEHVLYTLLSSRPFNCYIYGSHPLYFVFYKASKLRRSSYSGSSRYTISLGWACLLFIMLNSDFPSFLNTVIFARNAFRHELTILEKARHPNLVQFVGAITQHVPMMIVSEYHPKVSFIWNRQFNIYK